jgi:MFS family permease
MLGAMAKSRIDCRHTLRSLHARNFRRFLASQTASQCGMWLHFVGLAWLANELTGSGTAIGWVAVAMFGPLLVLGPWTGALADRVDKHRLLIAMQMLVAGAAAALGAVVLAGVDSTAWVYGLTLGYGLLYAVETPVRRAFIAELVGEDRITNAVSLYNAVSAVGRVLGPVFAGVLIASAGVGWCFVINAVCYVIGLTGLLMMRRDELRIAEATPEPRAARAGLRYAWSIPELRIALLLTGVVATFGFNHQVLVPLLAHQTFDGGVGTFTLLYASLSVGSVVGALIVAGRREVDVRFLVAATVAFAAANGLVAVSPNLALAVVASVGAGATALLFVTASTVLLQRRCSPAMRGRVMALAAMVLVGGIPIGGPIVGWIADMAGPRIAVAVGSMAALLAGAVVLRHLTRRNTQTDEPGVPRSGADSGPVHAITSVTTSRRDNDSLQLEAMS